MAMPTMCAESDRSSISRSTARLSASVRAVETTLTKSGQRPQCARLPAPALGPRKVVKAHQESAPVSRNLVNWADALPRPTQLEIHNLAAGLSRGGQYLNLRIQRSGEVAAIVPAPAGGDRRNFAMFGEEFLEPGQSGGRFGKESSRNSETSSPSEQPRPLTSSPESRLTATQTFPAVAQDGRRGIIGWELPGHGHQLTHLRWDARRMQ